MKIGIIAYENCTASMVIGMMDILSVANSQRLNKKKTLFEISILTTSGQSVRSFTGYSIVPSYSILSKQHFDMVYVPGFLADPLITIEQGKSIIKWLKGLYKKGTKLIAACNGNLLLAEAGVLNGKSATTHWSLKEFFQSRYPDIDLQPEKIIVDEGDVISAAGVTAYLNLALYLVAKYGSIEMAAYCSKIFLVDSGRKIQTPYLIFSSPKNHGDKDIIQIQTWIESNFQEPLSVEALKDRSSMSRRTLIRRFKIATGDTPLEYVQRVRIENAKRYLETTNKTFSEITWDVGYNDISSFQRLFKLHTRLTPKEYRNKFTLVLSNA